MINVGQKLNNVSLLRANWYSFLGYTAPRLQPEASNGDSRASGVVGAAAVSASAAARAASWPK